MEVKNLYIQLDRDMNLVITDMEPIRRGDDMARKVIFLVPKTVGDIDMASAALYLSYRRADGAADIDVLKREDAPYNANYYEYRLPVTTLISRFPGEVTTFITVFSGPHDKPMVLKSGVCVLHVEDSENLDDVISDRNLRLVYSMQKQMENKIKKTEEQLGERIDETNTALEEGLTRKADNVVFNEIDSTLQLMSGNAPIGDMIAIKLKDESVSIEDAEINEDGELVLTFSNGTIRNLGNVVGKDGIVYAPHIDAHKVLTFTIETEPTAPPEPVDLNSSDEWSSLDDEDMAGDGGNSDYVWDTI